MGTLKKDKRGVSDVITTVLIILLVLAAVAIIGGILLRNIGEAGSKIGTQTACIDLDVKPVSCALKAAVLNGLPRRYEVLVSRGARGSDATVSAVTLLFENSAGVVNPQSTPTAVTGTIPLPLQTSTLTFNELNVIYANVRTTVTLKGVDGKDLTCEPSTVKVNCA